jgi:hypothetical protein
VRHRWTPSGFPCGQGSMKLARRSDLSNKVWCMGEIRLKGLFDLSALVMAAPTGIVLLLGGTTMDLSPICCGLQVKLSLSLSDERRWGLCSAIMLEMSSSRPWITSCYFPTSVLSPCSLDVCGGVDLVVSHAFVTPRISNPHDYVNHMFKRP